MNFAIWVSFLKIQLTVATPLPLPLCNLFLQQNTGLWAVITHICFVWLGMHSYGRIILGCTMRSCGITLISTSGDFVLPIHHTWLCHVMEMMSSLLVICDGISPVTSHHSDNGLLCVLCWNWWWLFIFWTLWNKTSVKFELNYHHFLWRKYIWKCCLPNVVHFV